MNSLSPAGLQTFIYFGLLAGSQLLVLGTALRRRRRFVSAMREGKPGIFAGMLLASVIAAYLYRLAGPAQPDYSDQWWSTPLQGAWRYYHAVMVIVIPGLHACVLLAGLGSAVGLTVTGLRWLAVNPSRAEYFSQQCQEMRLAWQPARRSRERAGKA